MAKKKASTINTSISLPSPKRRIEGKTNDKTVTLYANNVFVEASNWDVKIRLGLIQSATPELIVTLDVAHVYMSHEHAKAFADALTTTLQQLGLLRQKAAALAAELH